jgi:uncharacterized protein with PIN domain
VSSLTGESKTQAVVQAGRQLDALVSRAGFQVEPVTRQHADIARQARLAVPKSSASSASQP